MSRGDSQNRSAQVLEGVLWAGIIGLYIFRTVGLNSTVGHWGESQYALWVKGYLQRGFFWGVAEVDYFKPMTAYLPVASYLTTLVVRCLGTDIILTGRTISYAFSLATGFVYYQLAVNILGTRLRAVAALFVFTAIPVVMLFSTTLYNETIQLFFLVMLLGLLVRRTTGEAISAFWMKVFLTWFAVLVCKPTAILIIGPTLAYHFVWYGSPDRHNWKYAVAIALPVVVVATTIMLTKWYAIGMPQVETSKLTSLDVLARPGYYAFHICSGFWLSFQRYVPLFLVGFVLALKSPGRLRYIALIVPGLALFVLLFMPGVAVHAYYLLPLAIPFGILTALAVFRITDWCLLKSVWHAVAVASLLILFFPSLHVLMRQFGLAHARQIPQIAELVKGYKYDGHVLVVGKGAPAFQYYLENPVQYRQPNYNSDNKQLIKDLIDDSRTDIVIIFKKLPRQLEPSSLDRDYRVIFSSEWYRVYFRRTIANKDVHSDSAM